MLLNAWYSDWTRPVLVSALKTLKKIYGLYYTNSRIKSQRNEMNVPSLSSQWMKLSYSNYSHLLLFCPINALGEQTEVFSPSSSTNYCQTRRVCLGRCLLWSTQAEQRINQIFNFRL